MLETLIKNTKIYIKISALVLFTVPLLSSCKNVTQNDKTKSATHTENITGLVSITQGRATRNIEDVFNCDVPGWRVTANGIIAGEDGREWTVPADVVYETAPKATDLFNECNGVEMSSAKALDINTVPVVEIDKGGEVFSFYFFGDNYAEIFVNEQVIGVDPVPYWPFNTSVVRFKVKRPFMAGIKMIDWSENLGLGSETMRGVPFHTGDGGFVGVFKDSEGKVIATTDSDWKVKPYYIAPLLDASCVKADRTTEACVVPPKIDAEKAYGAHWTIPNDWAAISFDDSDWQKASLYTNEDIGGSLNRPAYQNFTGLFDNPDHDAEFIWSSNLLLDNVVLARKQIQ